MARNDNNTPEATEETDEVYATLTRSPIDPRCWVPTLRDSEDVRDCAYAGGIRAVKEAARELVMRRLDLSYERRLVWRRRDTDTWVLVASR